MSADTLPVPSKPARPPAVVLTRGEAEALVGAAAARYVEARRARIEPFIDRHFTLKGSLSLHRHALGLDLLRAPYNLAASLPEFAIRRSGRAAGWLWRQLGRTPPDLVNRAEKMRLILDTAVGRRVNYLLMSEFLELPVKDDAGKILSETDALAREILSDPRLAAALRQVEAMVAAHAEDPEFRAAVAEVLASAGAGRAAMAEVALQLGAIGFGASAFHAFTPGVLSLAPILSASLANTLAISAFPLGGGIGSLWYAAFPAAATPFLTLATGGTLLVAMASFGAFAGIATDPVQRRLGLHRRRLERLVDGMAHDLGQRGGAPLSPLLSDHYLPRVLDLIDLVNSLARLAR